MRTSDTVCHRNILSGLALVAYCIAIPTSPLAETARKDVAPAASERQSTTSAAVLRGGTVANDLAGRDLAVSESGIGRAAEESLKAAISAALPPRGPSGGYSVSVSGCAIEVAVEYESICTGRSSDNELGLSLSEKVVIDLRELDHNFRPEIIDEPPLGPDKGIVVWPYDVSIAGTIRGSLFSAPQATEQRSYLTQLSERSKLDVQVLEEAGIASRRERTLCNGQRFTFVLPSGMTLAIVPHAAQDLPAQIKQYANSSCRK